jgi:alkylated DNA repair dioxygenase AlkB
VLDLFEPQKTNFPEGFRYQTDVLSLAQEVVLLHELAALDFQPFEFHGFIGRRRVVSFGWRYDFNGGGLQPTQPLPPFLLDARAIAAGFAEIPATEFEQALVTEYSPGAAIGWHRDRSVYSEVIGLSLLAECTFRLRRKREDRFERLSLTVAPRSAYLLAGPSRTEWEHSIPAVGALRYSITFRRMAKKYDAAPANERRQEPRSK